MLRSPYSRQTRTRRLQPLAVDGYSGMVSGTVYPAGSLEQGGMPLGGLGTGYLCLDTDERLGKVRFSTACRLRW